MTEIIIGRKPLANYQGYIIIQINKGIKKLTLRAFGKHISKCFILFDWIRRHFPQFQKYTIKDDRSERGYIGVMIQMESSKNENS